MLTLIIIGLFNASLGFVQWNTNRPVFPRSLIVRPNIVIRAFIRCIFSTSPQTSHRVRGNLQVSPRHSILARSLALKLRKLQGEHNSAIRVSTFQYDHGIRSDLDLASMFRRVLGPQTMATTDCYREFLALKR